MARAPTLTRLLDPAYTCEDLLQCVFDLRDLDAQVFMQLAVSGPQKVEQLSEVFERDQSVVFRSLKRLLDSSLVIRQSHCLDRGGHYFVYEARELAQIQQMVHVMADRLAEQLHEGVHRLEAKMQEAQAVVAAGGSLGPAR